MGFQLLDLILLGIMLISGVLALMRGFTREVLSLVAWGLAALAAYIAIRQQQLVDLAMPYFDKPMLAQIAVGAVVFLLVLIIVSVISVNHPKNWKLGRMISSVIHVNGANGECRVTASEYLYNPPPFNSPKSLGTFQCRLANHIRPTVIRATPSAAPRLLASRSVTRCTIGFTW